MHVFNSRDRRPVVLFVHGPRSMGGDSVVVLRTLERLDLSRINPIVVAPPECEVWQRFEALADAGRIRLLPLEMGVVSHLEKDLPGHAARARMGSKLAEGLKLARAGLQLIGLILRERVDVVYTMDRSRAVPLATLAARLLGRGLVFHGHCPWNGWEFAVRAAHQIVVITDFVKREYARNGIDPDRIQVIHNGIDVEYYASVGRTHAARRRLDIDPTTPMVVMPGRLSRYKGQLELVEAVPDVLRQVPNAQFVIAGGDSSELGDLVVDGPSSMLAVLTRRADELGIRERIHFTRPTDREMAELYADADAVVVPSWSEPFGLVVVEAMAAGTAVIGSAAGGIPESIIDGDSGLLVPACDPRALGQAIVRLLADPSLRADMARNGQARVRSLFTIERYMHDIQEVLLTVATRKRRNRAAGALVPAARV